MKFNCPICNRELNLSKPTMISAACCNNHFKTAVTPERILYIDIYSSAGSASLKDDCIIYRIGNKYFYDDVPNHEFPIFINEINRIGDKFRRLSDMKHFL